MKKIGAILLIMAVIFVVAGCTNDYDLQKANGIADSLAIVISSYVQDTGNTKDLSVEITLAAMGKEKTFTVDIIPIKDETTVAELSNSLSEKILAAITDSGVKSFGSAIINQHGKKVATIDEHYVLSIIDPFSLNLD